MGGTALRISSGGMAYDAASMGRHVRRERARGVRALPHGERKAFHAVGTRVSGGVRGRNRIVVTIFTSIHYEDGSKPGKLTLVYKKL